jgi:tRNA-dihydrouridine synthase 3
VQLAGTDAEELAWAAALCASRGADFVDLNLGCPIDQFTRKGMGAALARQPRRVARLVAAMAVAAPVPVTVKIRLGWNDETRNYLEVARAAADAGAAAVFVHGRTRNARYRLAADWHAIGEVAAAVPVPVVGNGDLLFPHEIEEARRVSGCAGVMVARGALIKPWLFREAARGEYWNISAEERVGLYRRWVTLARLHWGTEERARRPIRDFLRWHVGFWVRYRPRRADGSFPGLQVREDRFEPGSPLEGLLARTDDAALDYVTDALLDDLPIDPDRAPAVGNEDQRDNTASLARG